MTENRKLALIVFVIVLEFMIAVDSTYAARYVTISYNYVDYFCAGGVTTVTSCNNIAIDTACTNILDAAPDAPRSYTVSSIDCGDLGCNETTKTCNTACTPSWKCNGWGLCTTADTSCSNTPSGTQSCDGGWTDLNNCGQNYTGSNTQSCTITRNTDGKDCGSGSCVLASGVCGTGTKTVKTCSGGSCTSSSPSCTVGCPDGQSCSSGNCVASSGASPAAPSSPSPADGATNISTTPTLSWSNTTSGSGWYYLYYKKSADAAYTATPQLNTNSYTLPTTLSAGTTYNWNVRACNPGPACTDSATWSFTTLTPPPCTGTISLSINPSPASPGDTVTLSASGLSDGCNGKTVTFYAPVSFAYKLCPGAIDPPTATNSCIVYTCSSSGPGCSQTFIPENEGGPVGGTYTFTATVDKNGDGDTLDSGEDASQSLSIGSKSCTATQPSSGIVTLGNGCPVTIKALGYDDTDNSMGRYSEITTTVAGSVVTASGSSVTSTGIYTEFDDAISGGCDLDLGFTTEWAVISKSSMIIKSTKGAKNAAHLISYGYNATTSGGSCLFLDFTPACKSNGDSHYCNTAGFTGQGSSSMGWLKPESLTDYTINEYIVGECLSDAICVSKHDSTYKCGSNNMCYQAFPCDKNDNVDGTSSQCIPSKSFCALDDPISQYYKSCVECLPGDKGNGFCVGKYGVGYTCDAITYSCVPPKGCISNNDCDPGFCCTRDESLPVGIREEPTGSCVSNKTVRQPYLCTAS